MVSRPVQRSLHAPVLVVDDDQAIRETLHDVLVDNGYTVYEASDGPSALRRLRSTLEPLVVLLDWWMPRMDGLAVLQAITDDGPATWRHAFILLSASIDRHCAPGLPFPPAIRLSVMAKPFDLDAMLVAVAREDLAVRMAPQA